MKKKLLFLTFMIFATTQTFASTAIIKQLPTTDKDAAKLIKDVALPLWSEEQLTRWMEQVGSDTHTDLMTGKTPEFLDAVQTFHIGYAIGSKQMISANFRALMNLFSHAQANSNEMIFLSQYLSARDAQIVADKLPAFMDSLEATLVKNNRKK